MKQWQCHFKCKMLKELQSCGYLAKVLYCSTSQSVELPLFVIHLCSRYIALCLKVTPKGPSIKDVRRDGEGVRSNADSGGKGPCRRLQDGTFFRIVLACFANTSYGRWLLKYKLLIVLFDLHHII